MPNNFLGSFLFAGFVRFISSASLIALLCELIKKAMVLSGWRNMEHALSIVWVICYELWGGKLKNLGDQVW